MPNIPVKPHAIASAIRCLRAAGYTASASRAAVYVRYGTSLGWVPSVQHNASSNRAAARVLSTDSTVDFQQRAKAK